MENRRVLLGMSGGVDSAGAALLLQRAGYEVVGVTLCLQDAAQGTCGSAREAEDAAAAAGRMGIPHLCPDCAAAFRQWVVEDFVGEYLEGHTPNPCVRCNRFVKFPSLLRLAEEHDCRYIATGHYARVRYDRDLDRWQLLKGTDQRKDQSYVLYPLGQEILSRLLLPVGMFGKPAIRAMAQEAGLANAAKPDSQDICFIPDGDYVSFLEQYSGKRQESGDFVDETGRVLGRHRGLAAYTLGQRRGLGVSADRPLYVVGKNEAANQVILGDEKDLYSSALTAHSFNWVSIPCPEGPVRVEAKTRYSQRQAEAVVEPLEEGRARIVFDQPQRAVTPGQSVVLYQGDLVIGGGIIEEAEGTSQQATK